MTQPVHDNLPTSAPPQRLGFGFRFSGGSGVLSLAGRSCLGWLMVDRLELEVPDLRLPIDLTVGPELFQRRRTRARRAELRCTASDLARLVALGASQLAELGIHDVELAPCNGYIAASARLRQGVHRAELTCRLFWQVGPRLRIDCDRPLLYGHFPVPASVCAHYMLTALFASGGELDAEPPASGLAHVEIDPLAAALWQLMPAAGWRMPDLRAVAVRDVTCSRDGIVIHYGRTSSPASATVGPTHDAERRVAKGDRLLLAGDHEGAAREYRVQLASQSDQDPLACERLLGICAGQTDLAAEGSELAHRALARWPDFMPAFAALASIALNEGDPVAGARHLAAMSDVAAAGGDPDAALHAALAAARLLRRSSPAEATPLYQRVLELRPAHAEAGDALADRYAAEARWPDLAQLLRARVEQPLDTAREVRDRILLAQLLVERLHDTAGAREQLGKVLALDGQNAAAGELVADLAATDAAAASGAIAAYDRAADLYRARGDARGWARSALKAAALAEGCGEFDQAERRYHVVAEAAPAEVDALRGAARSAARRNDAASALERWRVVSESSAGSPLEHARDSLELGRAAIAVGDMAAGQAALERAGGSSEGAVACEAHVLLADLAEREGRRAAAAAELRLALLALERAWAVPAPGAAGAAPLASGPRDGTDARFTANPGGAPPGELRVKGAHLAARRAALLESLEQSAAAGAELERALELAGPDTEVGLAAARRLADRAHREGETRRELALLRLILQSRVEVPDRARLIIRRAQLAASAGGDARAAADLDALLASAGSDDAGEERTDDTPPVAIDTGELVDALLARAELARATDQPAERAATLERAAMLVTGEAHVELSLAAADALIASGDAHKALARAAAAEAVLSSLPAERAAALRPRVLAARGEAAWRARRWNELEAAYAPLLGTPAGEVSTVAHRLGMAREHLGRYAEAAAALEIAVTQSPPGEQRANIQRRLAGLHERTGDLARAAAAYEANAVDSHAEVSDAQRAEAWYRAGELYRRCEGRSADAERCLEAALLLASDHMPSLDVLERLKRESGDDERVAVILGRKIAATARQPQRQKALLVRFAALQGETLGRADVARQSVGRALAIDPDFRPALRLAARDALATDDLVAAAAHLGRLARALPGDVELNEGAEALAVEQIQAAINLADLPRRLPPAERDAVLSAALEVVGQNLLLLPDHAGLMAAQASLAVLATAPVDEPATAPGDDPNAGRMAEARDELLAGRAQQAVALLNDIELEQASDALLEMRAAAFEACGQPMRAIDDLEELRQRAVARREGLAELRTTRRLAALVAENHDDDRLAVEHLQRVLTLDPDDLGAAEAIAAVFARRAEPDLHRAALLRVLDVARRAGAGREREAGVLRDLAHLSRSQGDVSAAEEYLDQACAATPMASDLVRERALLAAERGQPARSAELLEALAARLLEHAHTGDSGHVRAQLGEVLLELSDLYYDRLADVAGGRAAMRRAADAFGPGARRDAALRLLASEAATAGAPLDASAAIEAIDDSRRQPSDRQLLARCLQQLGRDQAAIAVLESARAHGALTDDGALLLFALHRQRRQTAELASALERDGANTPPDVALTRLREALHLHEHVLDDRDAARRVRERLAALTATAVSGPPGSDDELTNPMAPPSTAELVRAAEQAAGSGDTTVAADLLARALLAQAHTVGVGLGLQGLQILDRLRQVAHGGQHIEPLVRGLEAAAAAEVDRELAAELWAEAAGLCHSQLGDRTRATTYLRHAFALTPADAVLFDQLAGALREAGDTWQLVAAYQLHLPELAGRERALRLRELAELHGAQFGSHAGEQLLREADGLDPLPAVAADRQPAGRADEELAAAHAAELRGDIDSAIAHVETAWNAEPGSPRALNALERLYTGASDPEALSETLGRMIVATDDRAARAKLWYRRSRLYRDVLHREGEAYRCLKEAFANCPDDVRVAHALRMVAMARGEWALAAALLYREIAAASDDLDSGALHLELGLIYDERLLDTSQAMICLEQALALDPAIPAAPRALARLYELAARNRDAAVMYERAADFGQSQDERARLLRMAAMAAERAELVAEARRLYALAGEDPEGGADARRAAAGAAGSGAAGDRGVRLALLEQRLAQAGQPEQVADLRRQIVDLASSIGDQAAVARHAAALLEADRADLLAFLALKKQATAAENWPALASLLAARAQVVVDPAERSGLLYELGRTYRQHLADPAAAAAAFDQALAANPEHPGALEELAEMAYLRNDWTRALALYARVKSELASLPPDVLAYRRGEIAEVLGRDEEACMAYGEAVELYAGSRQSLTALARTALRTGDLDRAFAASRRLLELLPPEDIRALRAARLQLAELSQRRGAPADAVGFYEQVLAEEPNSITALTSLLTLHGELANHAAVTRVLRSLIALTPSPSQRADLLYRLGETYRKGLGDVEQAADAFFRAVDLDPDHVPTLRRLLDHYWRSGDNRALLEVAVDLDRRGLLADGQADAETVGGAMVVAALRGAVDLAARLARWYGDGAPRAAAYALVELASRPDGPALRDLLATGFELCARNGLDRDRVRQTLAESAEHSQQAAALLAAWPAPASPA